MRALRLRLAANNRLFIVQPSIGEFASQLINLYRLAYVIIHPHVKTFISITLKSVGCYSYYLRPVMPSLAYILGSFRAIHFRLYDAGRYGRSLPLSYSSSGFVITFRKIARARTDAVRVIKLSNFFLSICTSLIYIQLYMNF